MATPNSIKSEKKHKKRVRGDDTDDGARKHKRPKSESVLPGDLTEADPMTNPPTKSKKRGPGSRGSPVSLAMQVTDAPVVHDEVEHKKKPKKSKSKFITPEMAVDSDEESQAPGPLANANGEEQQQIPALERKEHKERKKDKKDKKRRDRTRNQTETSYEQDEHVAKTSAAKKKTKTDPKSRAPQPDSSFVEVDAATSQPPTAAKSTTRPGKPKIPFVTQTISLYVPFFHLGFSQSPSDLASETLELADELSRRCIDWWMPNRLKLRNMVQDDFASLSYCCRQCVSPVPLSACCTGQYMGSRVTYSRMG